MATAWGLGLICYNEIFFTARFFFIYLTNTGVKIIVR